MARLGKSGGAVGGGMGRLPRFAACLARIVTLALLFRTASGAEISAPTNPSPKRVLILDSFGRDAAPFSAGIIALRTVLARELGEPVDVYDQSLEMARLVDPDAENTLAGFLERRFAQH